MNLKSLVLGNKFLGVELFSDNGKECLEVLEIHKKKNDLVSSNSQHLENFDEKINSDFPAYLVINTNQILYKEVDSSDANDAKILQKAFPNLNLEDFYFQIWRLENKSVVFISRKEYVDAIIKKLGDRKVKLYGFSLGLASISNITSFLKNDILKTNTFSIDLNADDKILSVISDKNQEEYNLNGLQVNNKNIVSFSAALNLVLDTKNNSGNCVVKNQLLADNYMQSSFFSKGFKVMVGFILGLLLINFLIFNHYFKKEQEVSASLEMNRNYIEKIKSLKEDIKTKEERVKIFSRTNASKSSILLNEITKNIPTSILLKKVSYHPLQKKIKENEPILSDDTALLIAGESIDKTEFTNWITALENLSWISSVSIVKYGNENGKEESFEIKVKLNDETQQ